MGIGCGDQTRNKQDANYCQRIRRSYIKVV